MRIKTLFYKVNYKVNATFLNKQAQTFNDFPSRNCSYALHILVQV